MTSVMSSTKSLYRECENQRAPMFDGSSIVQNCPVQSKPGYNGQIVLSVEQLKAILKFCFLIEGAFDILSRIHLHYMGVTEQKLLRAVPVTLPHTYISQHTGWIAHHKVYCPRN